MCYVFVDTWYTMSGWTRFFMSSNASTTFNESKNRCRTEYQAELTKLDSPEELAFLKEKQNGYITQIKSIYTEYVLSNIQHHLGTSQSAL